MKSCFELSIRLAIVCLTVVVPDGMEKVIRTWAGFIPDWHCDSFRDLFHIFPQRSHSETRSAYYVTICLLTYARALVDQHAE